MRHVDAPVQAVAMSLGKSNKVSFTDKQELAPLLLSTADSLLQEKHSG